MDASYILQIFYGRIFCTILNCTKCDFLGVIKYCGDGFTHNWEKVQMISSFYIRNQYDIVPSCLHAM